MPSAYLQCILSAARMEQAMAAIYKSQISDHLCILFPSGLQCSYLTTNMPNLQFNFLAFRQNIKLLESKASEEKKRGEAFKHRDSFVFSGAPEVFGLFKR